MTKEELNNFVRKACDDFYNLPAEEQDRLQLQQKKSWVISELMLANPKLSWAEARDLVEEALR